MNHTSAKSKHLQELVNKSYDLNAEYTDADGLFMEKIIEQEKDPKLKDAFQDLDEFMFGW